MTIVYDPLKIPDGWKPKTLDLTFADKARSRELPIRVYLPEKAAKAPVVIFSHGLGGSCKNNAFMGVHWSGRGYLCVFVQHPGSDDSVWRGIPLRDRMKAMNDAANAKNTVLRYEDIKFVLDELSRRSSARGELFGRPDTAAIGMCGHSFGAVTTQGVSGQSSPAVGQKFTDARISAAVMFSPSAPRVGDPKRSFGQVKIPWLLMTGTEDVAPIGGATVQDRLNVYPELPPGDKYELVLHGAGHMAFGDSDLKFRPEKRNPNHHRAILALATAFWDTYLKKSPEARAWLSGDGPRSILESKDSWKKK